MKGSLRAAGLLLTTAVVTTALPATTSAATAPQQADPNRLAAMLTEFTRVNPLQQLGVLGKMNTTDPGVGAVVNELRGITVADLLSSSIPSSPKHATISNMRTGQKPQPTYTTSLAVLKESAD
ncbi:hypothetical protein SMC26_34450 [Actinomadura fulvescens]|uniref:Secreted protein n=1 Tax=Actinomadura fulvescens TaxID=46160 RepID=A0ABN3QUW0_9ACTN